MKLCWILVNPYRLNWQTRLFMLSVSKTLTGLFFPSTSTWNGYSSVTMFPLWSYQMVLNWSLSTNSQNFSGKLRAKKILAVPALSSEEVWANHLVSSLSVKVCESFFYFIDVTAASQAVPWSVLEDQEKGRLRTRPVSLNEKQKFLLQVARFWFLLLVWPMFVLPASSAVRQSLLCQLASGVQLNSMGILTGDSQTSQWHHCVVPMVCRMLLTSTCWSWTEPCVF